MSASWTGSSAAASKKSRTAFPSIAPVLSSPSTPASKAWSNSIRKPEDVVVILGQGPIGLLFTMLVKRYGSTMLATDTMPFRRELVRPLRRRGRLRSPRAGLEERIMEMTGGRGADAVIVAASAPGIVEQAVRYSRPGSRILLFAQTSHQERIEVSGADVCVGERVIFGSYSASVDLQRESADLGL